MALKHLAARGSSRIGPVFVDPGGGTTWNSDGTQADIQNLHDSFAANGDKITIPAGTFTWTTQLTIVKGITLEGAGIGQTIIRDNADNVNLVHWTLAANQVSRLTGIEFQDGGRIPARGAPQGWMKFFGLNTNGSRLRMDHCKIDQMQGQVVYETVVGVVDHNEFIRGSAAPVYTEGFDWDNGGTWGDKSWSAATDPGSEFYTFYEDNIFTVLTPNETGSHDGKAGRAVFRYNTLNNTYFTNHGTESGGRARGMRAMEIYNNQYVGDGSSQGVVEHRSGGLIAFGNVFTGWNPPMGWGLGVHRTVWAFTPWGGADGTNVADVNDPAGIFFSGRAAADNTVSGSSGVVQVENLNGSSPNWTVDQWRGYTMRRTSNLGGAIGATFALILNNTSNTITYSDSGGYGGTLVQQQCPQMCIAINDTLEFRRVLQPIDAPGRAVGGLITGGTPVYPAGWNNQVTEPCYEWDNGAAGFTSTPVLRENEHYYNNVPMGTSLPGTCTVGSAFWKTNEGEWDSTNPGTDGQLYQCGPANTWTLYYTPYTYPHPLVTP